MTQSSIRGPVQDRRRQPAAERVCPNLLTVTTTVPARGVVVVRPVGEVDAATAPALQQAACRALEGEARALVFDLSEVTFLGMAGLRVLLLLARRATCCVLGGTCAVRRAMDVGDPEQVLAPAADLQEALRVCGGTN